LRPSRSSLFHSLLLFAIVLFVGIGCGPRWQVVRQASPNPLAGASKFALEPVHYESLVIGGKSDAEYSAGKDEKERASWMDDKKGTEVALLSELQARAQGLLFSGMPPADTQTFIVRTTVVFWEPGFYAVAARDSEMRVNVQILGPAGVIDEFTIYSRIHASMVNPSTGGRMRSAGKDVGAVVADYLKKRISG